MPRLISNEQISDLPADSHARFSVLEEIVRQKYEELAFEIDTAAEMQRLRRQYMSAVVGAAEELKIAEIAEEHVPSANNISDSNFASFTDRVDAVTLRIAMRSAQNEAPYSVKIAGNTKSRLLELTTELRTEVQKLHVSPTRKDTLILRINQFEKDLDGPRLNFGNLAAMAVMAVSVVSDLGGAGATVRSAVTAIQEVVGDAKLQEDINVGLSIGHEKLLLIEGPKSDIA